MPDVTAETNRQIAKLLLTVRSGPAPSSPCRATPDTFEWPRP